MSDGWEMVAPDTDRLPVPGGWLYRTSSYKEDAGAMAMALAFVPDQTAHRRREERAMYADLERLREARKNEGG